MTHMVLVRQLVASLRLLVVMTLLLGIAYPAVITLLARLDPSSADGSLVHVDGHVVGSALLGQAAPGPEWFQPRPSASDYAGNTSGGSNLDPTSAAQADARAQREAALRASNPEATGPVPEDALTESASGLDAYISVAYAEWQVPRVAAARGIDRSVLERMIADATDHALLGYIGQDGVNVTRLNAALAGLSKG